MFYRPNAKIGAVSHPSSDNKAVIQFAAEHYSNVSWVQFETEFRCAGRLASIISLLRVDFFAVEMIDSPFVTRAELVRSGCFRRDICVGFFAFLVSNFELVGF